MGARVRLRNSQAGTASYRFVGNGVRDFVAGMAFEANRIVEASVVLDVAK